MAALAVMQRIDQQWGAARTMIGLGDLARLRSEPDVARRYYTEALPIFREIDARPDIARCLAGLARVALEQKDHETAGEYLAESLVLSHSTGSRIGVARGLEAFAELAAAQDEPAQAVRLIAAAAGLRDTAGLRPLSGGKVSQYLAAAGVLGDAAVSRLWEEGAAMTPDQAVALALSGAGSVGWLAAVTGDTAGSGGGPGGARRRGGRSGAAAAEPADPAGTADHRADRGRAEQPADRRGTGDRAGHGGQARREHPGQAGVLVPVADRGVGEVRAELAAFPVSRPGRAGPPATGPARTDRARRSR